MNPNSSEAPFADKFLKLTAILGLVAGLLFFPALFEPLFAASELLKKEINLLNLLAVLLLLFSLAIYAFRKKIKVGYVVVVFTLLMICYLELFFRFAVYRIYDYKKHNHGMLANRTYPEFTAYKGHPFLGFTGRPSSELSGNQSLSHIAVFNNFGFSGNDFNMSKAPGTIRIAALGGSTTVSGYPQLLDSMLNQNDESKKYEVLNFGMTYWTSSHSLINFMLNVVDFNPDYIIFHHGWNEGKVRNTPDSLFRNDYSHALTYFHEPEIPDQWLLRASALYRELRFQVGLSEAWTSLEYTTTIHPAIKSEENFEDLKELYPFERNLRNLIDLCKLKNIGVILMTQPRTTDQNAPFFYSYKAIDQANDVVRTLGQEYQEEVSLVDLDRMVTGKYNHFFKDLGHMTPEGIQMKAQALNSFFVQKASVVDGENIPADSIRTSEPINR